MKMLVDKLALISISVKQRKQYQVPMATFFKLTSTDFSTDISNIFVFIPMEHNNYPL